MFCFQQALAGGPAPTDKEVKLDLGKQFGIDRLDIYFECVQILAQDRWRICFTTPNMMDISSRTWVSVQRLAYGIPLDEVHRALSPYGLIHHSKREVTHKVYTGTISVPMAIHVAIPSKLVIKGHSCRIWYRGQIPTCFRCGTPGHQSADCPSRGPAQKPNAEPDPPVDPPAEGSHDSSTSYSSVAGGSWSPQVVVPPVGGHGPGSAVSPHGTPTTDNPPVGGHASVGSSPYCLHYSGPPFGR